ncbi:o-succinylbenzoate--CoA ligase [Photobacterium lutimaris]|uniref:O-succinylbenzoate--CoA ligase n=1 Tax=Photobacterium lutimaris TaxID=388278 RepID=A0A2T3IXH4_9GAMM|nr:o-succinylbenzoate--CoA ligase [Photobacterium lutimaris]PSU33223.1 o-succinylbenzoate--CoA ligase [Photobacterium lutimaris]TDR75195.1 2-succinylbenzoyl-CoA synthetase [Photobacterium lutimaris]
MVEIRKTVHVEAVADVTFSTWPWQHWAKERPSSVALSFDEQQFSWAELAEKVDEYAKGLVEQGLKRDQLVAVVAPNSVSVIWLLLAILRTGARYVGLNPHLSQQALSNQLALLECDFIWYPAKSGAALDRVQGSKQAGQQALPHRLQLLPPQTPRMVPVTWQASRAATLTMTSGSTGHPKAVVHNAQSHLASAAGLLQWMAFDGEDSWLLSLPLFHISGMAIVWRWLYRGAKLVVASSQDLDVALGKVTHASLVPTQLQRVLENNRASSLSLKRVLLGGAVIPVSLTERAKQAGIECWCGYGMTEMASTVTAKLADTSAGVGAVLPHRELMLKDGEVLVKGKASGMGYYRNRTIFPFSEQEWFATKDLASWHDEELFILGRKDNMFISGGENIQPEEIEKVLLSHPAVDQAFVLPMADKEYGQRPVAIVSTSPELDETLNEDLDGYMKQQVMGLCRPVKYLLLPSHLCAGGIKISRKQLAQWLTEQH